MRCTSPHLPPPSCCSTLPATCVRPPQDPAQPLRVLGAKVALPGLGLPGRRQPRRTRPRPPGRDAMDKDVSVRRGDGALRVDALWPPRRRSDLIVLIARLAARSSSVSPSRPSSLTPCCCSAAACTACNAACRSTQVIYSPFWLFRQGLG